METKKIKTDIEGLDFVLEGGIPAGSTIIFMGAPGTGKTTLVQNIIFNKAKEGQRTLYITTLGEPLHKLIRFQSSFSFFQEDLIEEKIFFRDVSDKIYSGDIDSLIQLIDREVKNVQPNFLVIDSIKSIREFLNDDKEFRKLIFNFSAKLAVWDVTAFFLGEYTEEDIFRFPEYSVVDGIIHLYGLQEVRFQKRYLRVLKLRGSGFMPGQHLFTITKDGISVYPRVKPHVSQIIYKVEETKESLGVKEIDNLLEGGVRRGSIVLATGPTGVGKTTLSLFFAKAAADKGEVTLMINFEETPDILKYYAIQIGLDLPEDKVYYEFISPVEVDLEYEAYKIFQMLEEKNISRLVLDSLNSFYLAAHNDRLYRDFLWGLLNILRKRGVTSYLALETENLPREVVFSDVNISILSDVIITMAYVYSNSEIKRALTILKARGQNHDKTFREFEITPKGIKIGNPVKISSTL